MEWVRDSILVNRESTLEVDCWLLFKLGGIDEEEGEDCLAPIMSGLLQALAEGEIVTGIKLIVFKRLFV